MTTSTNSITLRKAALIAGIGYLLIMGSPIAEAMFYHGLVDLNDGARTVRNIAANTALAHYAVFLYLINFMGDFLAAWAIYVLFKPVMKICLYSRRG